MVDRQATQTALGVLFEQTDGLARDLSDQEWSTQSLCPDWDVRGCVSHMAGVEHLLVGWRPAAPDEPPPFERMRDFELETANSTVSDFIDRVGRVHEARKAELAEITDAQWALPCVAPIGRTTYGRFMNVRVFDYWVHIRDITIPLERSTDDGGPGAEIALDEVHGAMGYIVGKKIGLPEGMSITFELSGGINRRLHTVVDARATIVDDLENPDVLIKTDSTTFIMLACGRIDPTAQIESGAVSWSGPDEWGEKAALNLRFTR